MTGLQEISLERMQPKVLQMLVDSVMMTFIAISSAVTTTINNSIKTICGTNVTKIRREHFQRKYHSNFPKCEMRCFTFCFNINYIIMCYQNSTGLLLIIFRSINQLLPSMLENAKPKTLTWTKTCKLKPKREIWSRSHLAVVCGTVTKVKTKEKPY